MNGRDSLPTVAAAAAASCAARAARAAVGGGGGARDGADPDSRDTWCGCEADGGGGGCEWWLGDGSGGGGGCPLMAPCDGDAGGGGGGGPRPDMAQSGGERATGTLGEGQTATTGGLSPAAPRPMNASSENEPLFRVHSCHLFHRSCPHNHADADSKRSTGWLAVGCRRPPCPVGSGPSAFPRFHWSARTVVSVPLPLSSPSLPPSLFLPRWCGFEHCHCLSLGC